MKTDLTYVINVFSNINIVSWKIRSRWFNYVASTLDMNFLVTHIFRITNGYVDSLAIIRFMSRTINWFNIMHNDIDKYFLFNKFGTPRLRIIF